MKDLWLTAVLALGAFAAFYGFFVGPGPRDEDGLSRPLSTETRANGYFALRRWLETGHVPVVELRQRYDWLLRAPGLPETGNLLLTTIPHERMARQSELGSLYEWMGKGNAVVVAAGILDTPEWSVPEPDTLGQLYRLSGLEVLPVEEEGAGTPDAGENPETPVLVPFARLDEPKRGVMHARGDHALLRGVASVEAVSEYPAGQFEAHTPADVPMLSLMSDEESGLDALWLTWSGDGAVLVSGYGSIFTNKMLANADNAALLANAVSQLLGPGGHVIFDDMHQGSVSFYDAEAFFGDPRLHATFWWVIALWLLWVLGSTRLPPPPARPAPVRERAFVQSTGNFFARALHRRRIAKRMFANFFDDQRRSLGLPEDEAPLWDRLRGSGAVAPAVLARVEALHGRVASGKRVSLVELHNRLQQLRKQLT